jgi:ectoine hydroxylase-related dioxygenase (phytanoyl-CoA dioxygenase family)
MAAVKKLDYVKQYREKGYTVIRQFFNSEDIQELSYAMDELKFEGLKHEKSFRHKNLLFLIQNDPISGKVLRFCQWPSYSYAVFEKYRTDIRFLEVLRPLLGENIKQIINQVIWKTPGVKSTSYGFHQDARFRRPPEAYRNLADSFIQTSLAIDPNTAENGCLVVIEGSHLYGDLQYHTKQSVYEEDISPEVIEELGLSHLPKVNILLEPGDLAIWHPFLLHGSGPNLSDIDRRNYLNGYVIAENCERGEWAFKNAVPVKLGEPMLVQYDNLYNRPEPHYLDGEPHPIKKTGKPADAP